MDKLYDMHCHLDFADNFKEVARCSAGIITAVNSTVVPSSFVSAREKLGPYENIHVALGLHPWWIADGRAGEVEISSFTKLIGQTSLVGEIGLDFQRKYKDTKVKQMDALARILESIADAGSGRLIFIHCVRAYQDLFRLFDEYETFKNNTCVFHWFSGNEDDFGRALAEGCQFSVGMRMLAGATGSFFAKNIPAERLMMETDNPPQVGMVWSEGIWQQELEATALSLAQLRECSIDSIMRLTAENGQRLLQEHNAGRTAA